MSDLELLEDAARAAGIEGTGYVDRLGVQYVAGTEESPYTDYFNPLTNYADTFMLAAACEIVIDFAEGLVIFRANYMMNYKGFTPHNLPECARAVVAAAAEIWRARK